MIKGSEKYLTEHSCFYHLYQVCVTECSFWILTLVVRMIYTLVFSDLKHTPSLSIFVSSFNTNAYSTQGMKNLFNFVWRAASDLLLQVNQLLPKVFFSYCWCNSHDAIAKGTKDQKGSLGWGDPRKIKENLEENGIRCWMDVERVQSVSIRMALAYYVNT